MSNWSEINPQLYAEDPELFARLESLYPGGPDDVDAYVGGMLETSIGPGPTFRAVIKEQFERIRDGDRFWFENEENG